MTDTATPHAPAGDLPGPAQTALIVVCGMATLDIVHYIDEMPAAAEKYRARESAWVLGGGAANAAVSIARLGGNTELVCRIGDDPVGHFIEAALREQGVGQSLVVSTPGARSSFSSIFIDASGERLIMNDRGCALAERIPERPLPSATAAVLADTRWSGAALPLLQQAAAAGLPRIIDAEPPLAIDLLQAASHIAFSEQGLAEFALAQGYDTHATKPADRRTNTAAALAAAGREFGAWVCVTRGSEGVTAFASGATEPEYSPAFPITAVDTLGAGDVWHGVFAYRLGLGDSESAAVRYASAAAAIKCTRAGGGAVAPEAAEIDALLSA